MSDVPVVSVLMVSFNRADLIGQAVRSVLGQTFGEFELIILDNSSDGKPYAVLEEFARADGRVRLRRVEESRSIQWCRQALLEMARGEFVAPIEDDDWWALDKLERQVACLCAGMRRWGC